MNHSLSLLQNASKADVRTEPYPHIVVDNALPDDLYEELSRSFPSLFFMGISSRENNKRWNYSNKRAQKNYLIPKLWCAFLAYHSSQDFFNDVVNMLDDGICTTYPNRFPSTSSLREMNAGARGIDAHGDKDVLLEALISGNTPVTKASSVRTTHVDAGDKLFAGMFYMRPDDYTASGGDLTVSRFKPEYSGDAKLGCFKRQYVDESFVETVDTIGYARNRLVLFVNSLDSLHGVTVRQPTRQVRRFVNLVGEVRPPLFELPRIARLAATQPPQLVHPVTNLR